MESFGSLAPCSHLLYRVRSTPSISASSDCVRLLKSRRFLSLLPSIIIPPFMIPFVILLLMNIIMEFVTYCDTVAFCRRSTGAALRIVLLWMCLRWLEHTNLWARESNAPTRELRGGKADKNLFRISRLQNRAFKNRKRPQDFFLRPLKRPY